MAAPDLSWTSGSFVGKSPVEFFTDKCKLPGHLSDSFWKVEGGGGVDGVGQIGSFSSLETVLIMKAVDFYQMTFCTSCIALVGV